MSDLELARLVLNLKRGPYLRSRVEAKLRELQNTVDIAGRLAGYDAKAANHTAFLMGQKAEAAHV